MASLPNTRANVLGRSDCVEWRDNARLVPQFFTEYLDPSMTQGSGWKLAPVRVFPDRHELALDNDCILWAMPTPMQAWWAEPHRAELGLCGAHFVGTNARSLPWSLEGKPANEYIDEHWRRHLPELRERVRRVAPDCPW